MNPEPLNPRTAYFDGSHAPLVKEIQERAGQLIEVAFEERRKLFPKEVAQVVFQFARSGAFGSSAYMERLRQLYENEAKVRAVLVWKNLYRAHQSLGAPIGDEVASMLKGEFNRYLQDSIAELSAKLSQQPQIDSAHIDMSQGRARTLLAKKHELEIDIYLDSLRGAADHRPVTQQYNFYGAVVQTGASACANVVQTFGSQEKEAIISALSSIRQELHALVEIAESQRDDIAEIIDDTISELRAEKPNNSRVRALLTSVAATVQTAASVQPAYQALKQALLALGIPLP